METYMVVLVVAARTMSRYVTLDVSQINAGFGYKLFAGMDETSCLASYHYTWIGTSVNVAGCPQNGMASQSLMRRGWKRIWNVSDGNLGRIGTCYLRFQMLLLAASVHEALTPNPGQPPDGDDPFHAPPQLTITKTK